MQAVERLYVPSPLSLSYSFSEISQIVTIYQDLVTYAVSEIKPCLRVREAVEGSGKLPARVPNEPS